MYNVMWEPNTQGLGNIKNARLDKNTILYEHDNNSCNYVHSHLFILSPIKGLELW